MANRSNILAWKIPWTEESGGLQSMVSQRVQRDWVTNRHTVVMYGCESWTIKKSECQRTDAFELCCWKRLLKVPWTTRRSNQSILKEINPEHSLEGDAEDEAPVLWPPDWWFGWLIGKYPDAGEDWGQEEKVVTEDEMVGWHHRLRGHEFE